ncbi:kinase-like protein [Aspergillus vadensis CBS 113365]|uniref:Kinase-like protein n=1 Tax=Aspergillus vadensis (strain CBS 113365 / IMI 142717 / IBT 24658) TaxID=1448311 RepID=A0A319BGM7_ASPVC|nr:kinase-like protein [Aspergillus vadensis CBS 113365]PYH71767.1 kinase-like protein [Aspergillus vadensis CBS 113365]
MPTTLRLLWYPLDTVFRSVYKILPSWKPGKVDVEEMDSSSSFRPKDVGHNSCYHFLEPPLTSTGHPGCCENCSSVYPPGVSEIIGLPDGSTVLKYPYIPGDRVGIEVEAELLKLVGSHPRIIASKGLNEHGLVPQYAKNGNVCDCFTWGRDIYFDQRLRCCEQAAGAVQLIHRKRVVHCDINVRNLLLDDNLDVLLVDFQGVLKSENGEKLLDGESRENSRAYMPRVHGDIANAKTDIFALGSLFYHIMTGHGPFPELNDWEYDEEIEERYKNGQFPTDSHACSHIRDKC